MYHLPGVSFTRCIIFSCILNKYVVEFFFLVGKKKIINHFSCIYQVRYLPTVLDASALVHPLPRYHFFINNLY